MSHRFARRKPTVKVEKKRISFAVIVDIELTKYATDLDAMKARRWLQDNLEVTDKGYEQAPINIDFKKNRATRPVRVRVVETFN